MLIGPLVRRLAAEAPGVTLQALPRFPDAARALRAGEVDLVIEPPEIMSNPGLPSQRLFDDRWMCCVWEGNKLVGDEMTLDAYRRLGHLTYSMGRGQAVSLADEHIAANRSPATSSSASRASCSRRSCCRAPTSRRSSSPARARTCAAPPTSGCSSRR